MTAQAHIQLGTLDDGAIARLCASRDAQAIRHVTMCNNQRLFRAAWSILKDRSEAEEAVQAAYVSAFAAIEGFAGRSSLSTWLTRIVINESLGRLRSERRRRKALGEEGVALMEQFRDRLSARSNADAPDSAVARAELRRLIEKAVADLPDMFRTVFVLREIEGLSVEAAAEALQIPVATVKTRTLRARRRLQQSLAPEVRDALEGSFPFAGADCARMTRRVLDALTIS